MRDIQTTLRFIQKFHRSKTSIRFGISLMMIGNLVFPVQTSIAQTVSSSTIKQQLSKIVSITSGLTTAGDLAKELSKQTGAVIKADDYLEEHQLSVQMDGVSAASVLNAVSEMHHWRWIQNNKDEIILTHRRIEKPVDITEYGKAYLSFFPVAWLPFIGAGMDWAKLLTAKDRETSANKFKEIESEADIKLREALIEDAKNNDIQTAKRNLKETLDFSQTDSDTSRFLFPVIREELKRGARIPFSMLAPEERQSSLKFILLRFLAVQSSPGYKEEILAGKVRDYLVKPEIASLSFRGKALMIGVTTRTPDGGTANSSVGHSLDYLQRKDD